VRHEEIAASRLRPGSNIDTTQIYASIDHAAQARCRILRRESEATAELLTVIRDLMLV